VYIDIDGKIRIRGAMIEVKIERKSKKNQKKMKINEN
jgi:hypothetical protein